MCSEERIVVSSSQAHLCIIYHDEDWHMALLVLRVEQGTNQLTGCEASGRRAGAGSVA